MSATVARRIRRERIAAGLPAKPEPTYNLTDLPDTREQRRMKKFRKKLLALQEREASARLHLQHVAKWNRIFSAKPKKAEQKAAA